MVRAHPAALSRRGTAARLLVGLGLVVGGLLGLLPGVAGAAAGAAAGAGRTGISVVQIDGLLDPPTASS